MTWRTRASDAPADLRGNQTIRRDYVHPRAQDGERAGAEKEKSIDELRGQPGIVIQPWNPDTPYLKDLHAAKGKPDQWAVYMKNRAVYGTSPGFFLDCADFFREQNDPELSLQVLSNIAELELEDAALLRVLGHRLVQIGQLDLAVQTFERVLELRPEEPQSYRDLALTLDLRAEQATKDHSRPAEAIRADYLARSICWSTWCWVAGTRGFRKSRSSPWRNSTA